MECEREPLLTEIHTFSETLWSSAPIIDGKKVTNEETHVIRSPFDQDKVVGNLVRATAEQAQLALKSADQAWFDWNETSVIERAACLDRGADLLEQHSAEFIALCTREGAIPTFIAETGGQNAMIVDSTSLPEQVVADVMDSAFASAGQRCSALRVLYVQDDIRSCGRIDHRRSSAFYCWQPCLLFHRLWPCN